VLLLLERRGRPFPGRTFWGYLLLYGISRFIIEFYRGDTRGTVGMLSTSQFVSLFIVPVSIAMLIVLARRRAPTPTTAAAAHRAA
jgi:phosphatidylglycerol:prolipoprotein diacylglycerol transferase